MAEARSRVTRSGGGAGALVGKKRFGTGRYGGRQWRTTRLLAVVLAFISIAFVAAVAIEEGRLWSFVAPDKPLSSLYATQFGLCGNGQRVTCVVDGDTIWLDGTKIRLADIDTPEVASPSCSEELALGQKATARLAVLLNQGPFEVLPYARDTDIYGRKLRILSRDGTSLGAVLVDEGLAHVWDGSRHSWCG